MAINSITLAGNLTKDPELNKIRGGKSVLNFRIAVDESGGPEEAGFFNCQAWGDLGKHLATTLKRGDRVIVTGQLRQRSFDTKDGEQRSVAEMFVQDAGPSMLWATAELTKRSAPREAEPATV